MDDDDDEFSSSSSSSDHTVAASHSRTDSRENSNDVTRCRCLSFPRPTAYISAPPKRRERALKPHERELSNYHRTYGARVTHAVAFFRLRTTAAYRDRERETAEGERERERAEEDAGNTVTTEDIRADQSQSAPSFKRSKMAVQTCSDSASALPPYLLTSCMHGDDGVPRAGCHCGCGLFAGLEPAGRTLSPTQATVGAASSTPTTCGYGCPPLARAEEADLAAAAPMAAGARDCPCIKRAWLLQLDARLAQVRPCEPLPEARGCDDAREVRTSATGFCAVNTSDRRQHTVPPQLDFAAFLPPHSGRTSSSRAHF
jgi:hypothetical protein